ncbi:Protein FAR1-RELATED SEQUENCE 6 [Ananas comosus]|uniref:Protein FAR1-RELATED SEQUENCE n=1 Tax=Ananas comosus TaxID=4615 RepID=A0A199UWX0_ANACO|nr:Protein FAR1-RELATED SEQUENCE 6 [Ananas comosus]
MVVIEPNPDAEDRRRRRTNLRAPGAPPEAAAAPPPRGVAGAGDDGGDSDSDESPESARNNMRIKESSSGVEPAEDRSANSSEECSAGKENGVAAVAHEEPTTSAADDALVPKVGMRFKSIEEAFLFYTAYGYRTGFGVTRRTSHSMHGKKYRQTFTCCKEGNPRVKKAVVKCRRRPIVKCGCRAMMVIKDPALKDSWVIDYVILKHNHPLDPDRVRFMKCFRELPITIKRQLHVNEFQGTLPTMPINAKFQDEVRHLIQCVCTRVERNGPIVTYMVTELIESRQLDYKVTYNSAEHEVWCICCSFEYSGILCRHALCVLRQEFVVILPSKYVLARWRKDFKILQAFNSTPQMALTGETGNYDELVARGQQYLLDIADFAAFNHDMKVYALNALREARDKVVKQEVSLGDRTVDDDSLHNTLLASNICIPPNMDVQSDGLFLASATKVFDSPRAHPKVPHKKRPVSQRERASEELKKQRRENDSIIANKNVGLHVLENQSNAGVPMTQFMTQENFSVQVGSDPSPWLYNPSYFYWHGAGELSLNGTKSIEDPNPNSHTFLANMSSLRSGVT